MMRGTASASELASELQVSRSTVVRLLRGLKEQRIVVACGQTHGRCYSLRPEHDGQGSSLQVGDGQCQVADIPCGT